MKFVSFIEAVIRSKRPTLWVLADPAHEQSSKSLVMLRDQIVEQGANIIYPCPHSLICPLTSRDWCYSEFEWKRPKIQEYIDSRVGVERSQLSLTGLIMTTGFQIPIKGRESVVVGRPLQKSKKREERTFHYLVCTQSKGIQNQESTDANLVLLRGTDTNYGK
jgi:ribosomal protein RSM22 (predicted rRNA methylase)